jgi:hypothetical protein
MRLSATDLRASHQEAAALLETLERVEQLRLAYDVEALEDLLPWLERARDVSTRPAAARELARVRKGLEEAISEAAAVRADQLTMQHAPRIDSMMHRSQLLSPRASEVVAVIVDPRSPDIPSVLCARLWPVSVELARTLADDLRDEAPATADWLLLPTEPDEHRVIAYTLGRVMRTTRKIPSYADA